MKQLLVFFGHSVFSERDAPSCVFELNCAGARTCQGRAPFVKTLQAARAQSVSRFPSVWELFDVT